MQTFKMIQSLLGAGKAKIEEVGNQICPVSGFSVDSMGNLIKQEYHGKFYNLCCAGCVDAFSRNAGKYSRIALSQR